ncbi:MAG: hypothetical protein QOF84_6175, partial [Streptomyces sp.]|nr:hypothetical protein [Streptomyces sp.]
MTRHFSFLLSLAAALAVLTPYGTAAGASGVRATEVATDVGGSGDGDRAWPVAGPVAGPGLRGRPVVERGFDPPMSRWGAGHRGVDLRAGPGAPVR